MSFQPMSIDRLFGVAGTALNAQLTRMNTIASNLANAGTEASSEAEAFRAKRPVFQALLSREMLHAGAPWLGGVKVDRIVDDTTPIMKRYEPGNPKADQDGFVYMTNVNPVAEMVDMMEASRAYENNVEVVNTAKQLMMRTLEISKV